MLGGLAVWLLVAVAVGVVVGKGIRLADRRSPGTGAQQAAAGGDRAAAPATRRRVPLPPVGIALALLAVALEAVGYAVRLSGTTGRLGQTLSMDAPGSLPRLYVAALFAAAALAAVAGAASNPGRRTWWLTVGLVAAGISAVKAGGSVHVTVMDWLATRTSGVVAVVISAVLAVAVLVLLAVVSRAERRDRRRVLTAFALYAGAAVVLSTVSTMTGTVGQRLAAVATFVEETGEALAGVAVLVAVLVGVAPRLVLPSAWLRRRDDALSLDVPARQRPSLQD